MQQTSQTLITTTVLAALTALTAPAVMLADEPAFAQAADSAELNWGPCPAFMPEGCRLAVLHGDPAQPASDVFFRLPAGTKAPLHWHNSAERMVLITGEMQVVYRDQEPFVLKAGNYAYGPPKREHQATCVSEANCVLFIAFEEPVDAFPAD